MFFNVLMCQKAQVTNSVNHKTDRVAQETDQKDGNKREYKGIAIV